MRDKGDKCANLHSGNERKSSPLFICITYVEQADRVLCNFLLSSGFNHPFLFQSFVSITIITFMIFLSAIGYRRPSMMCTMPPIGPRWFIWMMRWPLTVMEWSSCLWTVSRALAARGFIVNMLFT